MEKRNVAVQNAEVDWQGYFEKIRSVCPWSLNAWNNSKIEITNYNDGLKPLGDLEARIYLIDATAKKVKSIADRLDQTDEVCEWLWSHPHGGGPYSTAVACIIQQDRKWLQVLREKINNKSNWSVQVGDTHSPKKEAL